MNRLTPVLRLTTATVAFLLINCGGGSDAPQPDAVSATGARLTVDFLGGTDVSGFLFDFERVPCDANDSFDPFTHSAGPIELEDMSAPSGLDSPGVLDEQSHHLLADHLVVLAAGCYDVVATPVDNEGETSQDCAPGSQDGVAVTDGQTTSVFLLSQCDGSGSGAVNAAVALNHPPTVTDVSIEPTNLLHECQPATACVTVFDVDGDPLELEWEQTSGPALFNAPAILTTTTSGSVGTQTTQCVEIIPQGEGAYGIEVTAYDLLDDGTRVHDLVAPEATSVASFIFPVHVSVEPEFQCWDDALQDLAYHEGVEPVLRQGGCDWTTPAELFCDATYVASVGKSLNETCPGGTFDAEASYPGCDEPINGGGGGPGGGGAVNGFLGMDTFGDSGSQVVYSVAKDGSGNIYTTGSFTGQVDFGSGSLTVSSGLRDVFVAKYDSDGDHIWSKRFGHLFEDEGYAIAVDSEGDAIVTGRSRGASFGTSETGCTQCEDGSFLLKLDGDTGDTIWVGLFGKNGSAGGILYSLVGAEVIVDQDDNIYWGGSLRGNQSVGGSTISANTDSSAGFVAKYAQNGAFTWHTKFGGSGPAYVNGLAIHGDDPVVTGRFAGTLQYAGINYPSAGNYDAFLTRLTDTGAHLWTLAEGGTGFDEGTSAAVTPTGEVLATGRFSGSVDFGGGAIQSAGDTDVFTLKVASTGGFLWANGFGGVEHDTPNKLFSTASGGACLAGNFRQDFDFAGQQITSAGDGDFFTAHLDVFGNQVAATPFGGASMDAMYGMAMSPSGETTLVGSFHGMVDFGGGVVTSAGGTDGFILRITNPCDG